MPLYSQLRAILREQILSGAYAPGEQIPTEASLVEQYGVSRITVRQSLQMLEEEGLILREVGRGTFVADSFPAGPALRIEAPLDDLTWLRSSTSVKLVDRQTARAGSRDAELLGIEPGEPLIRCTRVRFYEREPCGVIVNILPEWIGRKLTRTYLRKGSIIKFIEGKLKIHVQSAEQTVQATLADVALAEMLHTRVGSPLLLVQGVVRADDGTVVEGLRIHFRGELFSFSVRLTRGPSDS